VPPEFVVMAHTCEPTAQCKEYEAAEVVWDESEKVPVQWLFVYVT